MALAAGVVELLSPTFGFVFVSLAALSAAGLAAVGASLVWQLGGFSVVLLASLLFLRPRLVHRLGAAPGVASRTEGLVGRVGVITVAVDPVSGAGRMDVGGQDWAVRSSVPLAAGSSARVTGADGIVLLAAPADPQEQTDT